jgi:hypothetical protein
MSRQKQIKEKELNDSKLFPAQPPTVFYHKSVQNSCTNLATRSDTKNVHQQAKEFRENLYANGIAMQKIRGLSGLENMIKKRNSTKRNKN